MRSLLGLIFLSATLIADPTADRKVVLGLVDTCAQAPKTYEAEGFKAEGPAYAVIAQAAVDAILLELSSK